MPTPKKPADRRQRSNSKDVGLVLALPVSGPKVPVPQPQWRAEVVEGWNDFWLSMMAGPQVLKVTDHPALRRLFDMRHRLLEALDSFDVEPIVVGSTGQPTLSPWAQEVHRLESVVSKLEEKFGLTPLARLKLGVTFEEGINLAQRNTQLLEAFRASQA
jgi:hypothetical protein